MQPRFKAPIKGATAAPPLSSIPSWQSRKAPSATAGKHFFPFQQHTSIVRCIYTIFFFAVFFYIQLLVRFESMWLFPIHVLFLVISSFACVLRRKNLPEMRQTQLWELPSKMPLVFTRKFEKCFMSAQWGSIIYKETTNERVIPNLKRHVQHRVLKS